LRSLSKPISVQEVGNSLKAFANGSPGPDGIAVKDVKVSNKTALAAHFNVWLFCGYLPKTLRDGVTVLIPKKSEADKPEDFRPITMGSTVGRLFHKLLAARLSNVLPLSIRQKAFRRGDGIAENAWLLRALVRDHTSQLKALNLTFIDVKKAFDSVSHDSIILAVRRLGVPECFLQYIGSLYANVQTRIRVDGELSDPIMVGRGVRQGDPLSPLLFNAVIDWALDGIGVGLGAKMGKLRIGNLAFADDIVLASGSDLAMSSMLSELTNNLKCMGLEINDLKSASIRVQIDGKAKRWTVNPKPYLKVDGNPVPAMRVTDKYEYLGIGVSAKGVQGSFGEKLRKGLDNLSRAPLKPQQRLFLLNVHLLPSLYHELVFAGPSGATLKQLDRTVRVAVRKWLRLPKDTALGYFHADCDAGGLGVPALQSKIALMVKTRLDKLSRSKDPAVLEMIESSPSFRSFSRTTVGLKIKGAVMSSKAEVKAHWREALYGVIDGKGLVHHAHMGSGLSRWVCSGSSLQSGRSYVRSIHTRGNLHYTKVRASKGRPGKPTDCDACGKSETLGHILQVCKKTCQERIERHNRIVALVATRLRAKGYLVAEEDPIPTSAGIRRPDLVAYKEGRAATVIDVTIVSDAARLSAEHKRKVLYYDSPDIRKHVSAYSRVAVPRITFSSVTLNWRGALCPESDKTLTSLGFSKAEKELMSVRTVEGAYTIYAAHHCGTWRENGHGRGSRRP